MEVKSPDSPPRPWLPLLFMIAAIEKFVILVCRCSGGVSAFGLLEFEDAGVNIKGLGSPLLFSDDDEGDVGDGQGGGDEFVGFCRIGNVKSSGEIMQREYNW